MTPEDKEKREGKSGKFRSGGVRRRGYTNIGKGTEGSKGGYKEQDERKRRGKTKYKKEEKERKDTKRKTR